MDMGNVHYACCSTATVSDIRCNSSSCFTTFDNAYVVIKDTNIFTLYHVSEKTGPFVITGNIVRSTRRWYLIYSEADFEVFRPAGATWCTDGSEIWPGEDPPCQISPHQCNNNGIPQNWNFYWDSIKMWNINAPQGHIPCAIFTKIAEFEPRFRMH